MSCGVRGKESETARSMCLSKLWSPKGTGHLRRDRRECGSESDRDSWSYVTAIQKWHRGGTGVRPRGSKVRCVIQPSHAFEPTAQA